MANGLKRETIHAKGLEVFLSRGYSTFSLIVLPIHVELFSYVQCIFRKKGQNAPGTFALCARGCGYGINSSSQNLGVQTEEETA